MGVHIVIPIKWIKSADITVSNGWDTAGLGSGLESSV